MNTIQFIWLTLMLGMAGLAVSRADAGRGQPTEGQAAVAAAAGEAGPALPVVNAARVITAFHDAYERQGRPRVLVYVNRSLVTDRGEMLELAEVERTTRVKGDEVPLPGGDVQIGSGNQAGKGGESSGQGGEREESTRAAARVDLSRPLGVEPLTEMEVREIEEHFMRPMTEARVRLVDQRLAEVARRTFSAPGANFLTGQEAGAEQREVESLREAADVVVEVLARWRTVVIPEPSGEDRRERRIAVTATATRLKDGTRVAQVGSDTLFGFNERRGERNERRHAVVTDREILEQTALALMERMARAE